MGQKLARSALITRRADGNLLIASARLFLTISHKDREKRYNKC
ncbi:hypothetical protein HMPREF6485_0666 [Segatella buccae ATCC 33574]|uniref:Uncharacterized protein n=1 Tax=Segatella buccae ATCC 33574 TaxID=873513 RepID=E6K4Y0_9BACT|nr:hypothetical protein HMPREF6485_0666 [Segatella buccae ATCC 33574]